ncbi:MAG: two component transcriptional regulator, winged helix family [Verrucomicrobia bacterium]|nr:two component transcriptional regulator, winged helix family [Verrucomicrobiota bacterium]
MKPKILIVDDEPDALEVLGFKLREAGFAPIFAADGLKGLAAVRAERPDLVVLDLMLPELDGLEVCKFMRRDPATAGIPVLMLTAKAAEMDRVVGLELGADDYVTKPYSPRELVLRIRKLLKRTKADDATEQIRIGTLMVDVPRHVAEVEGKAVTLTATEFNLLVALAKRRGRVQSRERLLQDVWGYETAIDTRTVDTHMRRLREKIGPAADYLETIRGVGYRFKAGS